MTQIGPYVHPLTTAKHRPKMFASAILNSRWYQMIAVTFLLLTAAFTLRDYLYVGNGGLAFTTQNLRIFHESHSDDLMDASSDMESISTEQTQESKNLTQEAANFSIESNEPSRMITFTSIPTTEVFPMPPPGDDEEYVALCMLVKDEADGLKENVMHHYWHLGIRRFYILDGHSNPPLSEAFGPGEWGVPDSVLSFRYLNEQDSNEDQLQRVNMCLFEHAQLDKHTWIAVLDTDELIEMRSHDPNRNLDGLLHDESLVEFLQSFEKNTTVGAVSINWINHIGKNRAKAPVRGGWRKNFMTCLDRSDESVSLKDGNRVVKSIVKTNSLTGPGIHNYPIKEGQIHVNEHGGDTVAKEDGWSSVPVTWDRIGVHHYGFLSQEQYEAKMRRGSSIHIHRIIDDWVAMVSSPSEPCPHLATWYP